MVTATGMLDAEDPNNIPPHGTDLLVVGYLTGSPGQAWAGHHADLWVDQGSTGAPRYDATFMDVEPGAWSASQVATWMANARAVPNRTTVPGPYCDRNDFPAVRAATDADIWLAWPGWDPSIGLAGFPGVAAVQNVFAGPYDQSIILKPGWPFIPPAKEKDMINGVVAIGTHRDVPFPAGSFKQIQLYHDFGGANVNVRVAMQSKANGYSQIINPLTIPGNTPVTVTFDETDVQGVSLTSQASVDVGFTVA